MPLHLRVLWVDVLEVVWVAILSTCVARRGPMVRRTNGAPEAQSEAMSVSEASEAVHIDPPLVGTVVPSTTTAADLWSWRELMRDGRRRVWC